MRSLKNLKAFNQRRKDELVVAGGYIYVSEHLPLHLQQQKKRLLPIFNKARTDGVRAVFKIENASYCLYIDNVLYIVQAFHLTVIN